MISGVQGGRIPAFQGYRKHKRTPQKGVKNGTLKLLKKFGFEITCGVQKVEQK